MEISPIQSEVPLDRLAANTTLTEGQKVGEACKHFEAVLLRQILAEAQKPTFKSKYTDDSFAGGVYRDLSVQNLADAISRNGTFGLAQSLSQQLSRQEPTP